MESRRDFLKLLGIGAVAGAAGLVAGQIRPTSAPSITLPDDVTIPDSPFLALGTGQDFTIKHHFDSDYDEDRNVTKIETGYEPISMTLRRIG